MRSVLLIAVLIGVAAFPVFAQPRNGPLGSTRVVVELFTSQGCSSCPPADELLRKIARDPSLNGKVIPLAFHVDYWNYLGWRDPFSSREWSTRQAAYVRAMKLASAYTPQAVVNGEQQLVGSNAGALYDAIRAASLQKEEASLRAIVRGSDVIIEAQSSRLNLEAVVLVVENSVTTRVERGENEGRTLVNDRIVRQLVRAGRADGRQLQVRVTAVKNGEVVVLLQDPITLRIYAATTASR